MTAQERVDSRVTLPSVPSFGDWRGRLDRAQIAPVIAVAGSRGKTCVLRAVESIFLASGYRVASWTNSGVEIEGDGQRGELGPWSRALTRLHAGGLDIALREIDWATIQATGALGSDFPIVAVLNLCGNNNACLATPETLLAQKALARIGSSVVPSGRLILNANDPTLADASTANGAGRFLVGISADAPAMRRQLLGNEDAAWVADTMIVTREAGETHGVVDLSRLNWVRDIPFSVQNALVATAIARSCGISFSTIARGLSDHVPRPELMPGSFNVFDVGGSTIVIDRPMPSWFLRSSLRAAANLGPGRQIRVVGPMNGVHEDDLAEVGRLLTRQSGILLVHGIWDAERLARLRQGVASNEVPSPIIQALDERQAMYQGLGMLRGGDVMLVLAENASAAVRLVASKVKRAAPVAPLSAGAA